MGFARSNVLLIAVAVVGSACTSNSATRYRAAAGEKPSPGTGSTPVAMAPVSAHAAALPVGSAARPVAFRFDVGDEVATSVWTVPELTSQQRILRDGTISPPLLKVMPVVGLSVDELQAKLEGAYREFIKEPKVSVKVVSIRSDRVFVLGEVRTPQTVPFVGPTTVVESITLAGGVQMEFADRARVHLIRKGCDGQPTVTYVSLERIVAGVDRDPAVEPGDIIFVPPKGVTTWSRDVGQALAPLVGALTSASSVAALVIAAQN